ncbi:hypothetical protein PT974_03168 [Cladobotryum mycophilum]|uniref:Hydrophobin n=1 Tax=Cladobotryum mycophilum TaxID=491253 RepID=A0ABR0SSS7_9HYPO
MKVTVLWLAVCGASVAAEMTPIASKGPNKGVPCQVQCDNLGSSQTCEITTVTVPAVNNDVNGALQQGNLCAKTSMPPAPKAGRIAKKVLAKNGVMESSQRHAGIAVRCAQIQLQNNVKVSVDHGVPTHPQAKPGSQTHDALPTEIKEAFG